ncbi:hypothetical protein [Krasilnikovia sp. MM14-A1004]|uniref:hypothetical protein n=1 Tax=Krasilnikovia sp. MM14-A1004 TaxID=3373541 RepID=UPI00399CC6F5
MQHLSARRIPGVLAMAGVLVATVAGPARAGGVVAGDGVSVAFPDIDVPVGGTAIDPLGPNVWSTTGNKTLTQTKVTYDLKGVAGVRLAPNKANGGDCVQPSPTRISCTDAKLSFEGETVEAYLSVLVKADTSAERGDTGTVTITFSAKGVAPITGTSNVRVVRGGGGRLPTTGPLAGLIGGLGLLLVAGGAVGVLAARRRRARFLA